MLLLPGGWKVDLFLAELDSLGITVEQWQPSDPAINDDARSVDIFVRPNFSVVTTSSQTITRPDHLPSFEALLVLLLEKMEDKEWRQHFEKESPGDLAYLESLMSAIRGFFTEHGTTTEQDVLLARAGFPRTVYTGCVSSEEMRRQAAATTHSNLDSQIEGIINAHDGDTGLKLALQQLSLDIRRNLFAFVGCPTDQSAG